MIAVSDAWKAVHQRSLLPETFVEISITVADTDVEESVTITAENESEFSNRENIIGEPLSQSDKGATLEHNLWVLDGSRTYWRDSAGFMSDNDDPCSLTFSFPEARTMEIPGFVITWSNEHDEYPHSFTVTVKNGDTVLGSVAVTDNTSVESVVELSVSNYDSVTITVLDWSIPNHRKRIDEVVFGHVLRFDKNDILSYTHELHGNVNSSELSSNKISFTLNNVDGRWNPNNATGLERYLSEQQEVNVRYGMDIDGAIEWIKAGTFYLSEWRAPSNGLGANFVAGDLFGFLINIPYVRSGSEMDFFWYHRNVCDQAGVFGYRILLNTYPDSDRTITTTDKEYNLAEILQLCANATGCLLMQYNNGTVLIQRQMSDLSDYVIASALSYSHPEVELTKPLKAVSVDYGGSAPYVLAVSDSGETQTVVNPFIYNEKRAIKAANWIKHNMISRKTVSGEFRADPRLELFDIVSVESKYGVLTPVTITDIKYSYNGSFRASYKGVIAEQGDELW